VEETEGQRIAAPLNKVKRIWHGSPEPHYILPKAQPKSGLPAHCITAWLRSGNDEIVVVFFCDIMGDESLTELFSKHLHHISWEFLTGVDLEEERKIFDWYN
jgi:hypothetical protein